MQLQKVVELLKLFKGEKVEIKVYDNEFGVYKQELIVQEYELKEDKAMINGIEFICQDIMSLNIILDEDTIVQRLESAKSLEEAFYIAQNNLTPYVEFWLDKARERFADKFLEQESKLLSLIGLKIKAKGLKMTATSVLEHLLTNTIGTSKIVVTLEKGVFWEIHDKIDETIEKLEKEIF